MTALLLAHALVFASEEIPLWSPVPVRPSASPSVPMRETEPPELKVMRLDVGNPPRKLQRRLFHLGAFGSGALKTGLQRGGGGGGVEFGVRAPFWSERFGVILSPALHGLTGGGAGDASQSFWVSAPLGISYHEIVGPNLLRLRAALALDWIVSRTYQQSATAIDESVVSLGFETAAACVVPAGTGAFVGELGYHYIATRVAAAPERSHAFFLRAGYAFFL